MKYDSQDVDLVLSTTFDDDIFGCHDADLSEEVLRNPFDYLEGFTKAKGPVFLTEAGRVGEIDVARMYLLDRSKPVYFVSSFDSVQSVLRNPATFHQGYDTSYLQLMGPVPSSLNPPEHTAKRSLINQAFGRVAVERISADLIEPLARDLAHRIARRGCADLILEYTGILPFVVIAKLLDLPMDRFGEFALQSRDLMAMGYQPEAGIKASQDMGDMFSAIYEERLSNPGNDLISELAQAEVDGEALTRDDVVAFCRQLTPAGMETTTRSLGNLLVGLLKDEEQFRLLQENRDLIPNAVDEGLRWEGPALVMPKISIEAAVLDGVEIPKDTYVCVSHGLANRDGSRWDNPHAFDIRRPRKPSLVFSTGPHTCLGNQLAKKEMAIGLEAIFEAVPEMRLDPNRPTPEILGVMMRSPAHLHIVG